MSISNRNELASAVPVWLGRDGDPITSTQISDIIALAETGIIYGMDEPYPAPPVRLRFMETVDAQFALDAERVDLPAGFLEARSLVLNSDPKRALVLRSPQDLNQIWAGSSGGDPELFAIEGNQLRLAPAPGAPTTATFTYWALPRLSGPADTNSLLTNAPNVYLAACCLQAADLLGDAADADRWYKRYRSAVGGVQQSDDAGKWSGSTLQLYAPGPTP